MALNQLKSIKMSEKKISLTGIKPTGTPHLGNYLGAIKTGIEFIETYDESYYFIADYHALNAVQNPAGLNDSIYKVAATWLALGLDPDKCVFYKQSDVPEILEFNWILSCVTPKGFMNRAHAYKDKVAKNEGNGEDADANVNMGLYCYPCLMNADIIMFGATHVPVGKDQKQHLEFARDVAIKFNHTYNTDILTIPEPVIRDETDVIQGMDGRKMSKSYDNTIEIFLPEKKLKKTVNKIVTNSQEVEEPKNPDECNVFAIYKHFATEEQKQALRERYLAGGMGWGHAKGELFQLLNEEFKDARDKYYQLLDNRSEIDAILARGAEKARAKASDLLQKTKKTIGVI